MTTTIKRPADAFSVVAEQAWLRHHSLRPVRYVEPDALLPDGWGVAVECTECGWRAFALVHLFLSEYVARIEGEVPPCSTALRIHLD